MTIKKDSRQDPRARVLSMTVRYKSATLAEFIENHSYDISRGGMFIKTTSPFPAGTLLKFEVRIADEQKVMMGVGRVTWRRETERGSDKPAGMGVKFIKIGSESVALIQQLVESRNEAASSFEEGAADQGIRLSAPPEELRKRELAASQPPVSEDGNRPTPFFPATGKGPEVPSQDQSMLLQSSELLRAALQSTETARSAKESDGPEISADSEPPVGDGTAPAEPDLEDRLTLPTGETEAPEESQQGAGEPSAKGASSAEDSEDSEEDQDQDQDEAASGDSDSKKRDSKQPKSKRNKKKNPKKKKKKFKYSNIPTGKEPSQKNSEPPSITEMVTTPPKRAAKNEQPEAKAGGSTFKWLAAALLLVFISGGILLWRAPSTEPTPEPAVKTVEPPPLAAPEPVPEPEPEPAAEPEPEPSATATAEATPTAEPEPSAAAEPTETPAPRPRPKPRPKPAAPKATPPSAPVAPKPAAPVAPAVPKPADPAPVAPTPAAPKPAAPAPVTPTPMAPKPAAPAPLTPTPAAPKPAAPAPAPPKPTTPPASNPLAPSTRE